MTLCRLWELLRPGRGKCRVLFVCLGNACRSQMAEAFARAHASDVVRASSAGLLPSRAISSNTRMVMREKQISMECHSPKLLDRMDLSRFHMIVNLSGRLLPRRRGRNIVDWTIPDPVGHDLESYRVVRDRIEELVAVLAQELRAAAAARAHQQRMPLRTRLGWPSLWVALLVGLCLFSTTVQAGPVSFTAMDFSGPQWAPADDLWAAQAWQESWQSPPPDSSVASFVYSFWLDPEDGRPAWLDGWWTFYWGDDGFEVFHPGPGPSWIPPVEPPGGDLANTPEPASAALLALGLAVLIAIRCLRSNGIYGSMPCRTRISDVCLRGLRR